MDPPLKTDSLSTEEAIGGGGALIHYSLECEMIKQMSPWKGGKTTQEKP